MKAIRSWSVRSEDDGIVALTETTEGDQVVLSIRRESPGPGEIATARLTEESLRALTDAIYSIAWEPPAAAPETT